MRIYFSGIGGTGLAPLANLVLDAGYAVLGSDLHESDGTAELRQRGVNMSIGEQDGNFLRQQNEIEKIDLLVYTSALPADHAELLPTSRPCRIVDGKSIGHTDGKARPAD